MLCGWRRIIFGGLTFLLFLLCSPHPSKGHSFDFKLVEIKNREKVGMSEEEIMAEGEVEER